MSSRSSWSSWSSYVAVGDSFTEGVGDPDGPGGPWRGWADLVAARLAAGAPGFRYANLAVQGLRLDQILERQLPVALGMAPDLASLCVAGNDFLRPRVDPDALAARVDGAVAALRAAGATVLLFTSFDPRAMRVVHRLRGRVAIYNEHLRAVAERHDARVVDMWAMTVLADPRARVADRLHFSPEAHRRVALRVLEVLDVPVDDDWREPWPPAEPVGWLDRRRADAHLARHHLLPWAGQRLRRRPEGVGREAKRPQLLPLPSPGQAAH